MTVSTQKFLVAAVAAIPVPLVLFFCNQTKALQAAPAESQVKIRFQSDFQALVDMRSRHFACLRGVQMAWVDARSSAASSAAVSPAPWQISKMQSFKTATSSAFP